MTDYFKEHELGNISSDWENCRTIIKQIMSVNLSFTVDFITKVVCEYFKVRTNVFIKSRKREIVFYRQIIQYFAIKLTGLHLQQIGDKTGGYDHATCLNSQTKVRNLIDTDKVFKNQMEEIGRILKYSR